MYTNNIIIARLRRRVNRARAPSFIIIINANTVFPRGPASKEPPKTPPPPSPPSRHPLPRIDKQSSSPFGTPIPTPLSLPPALSPSAPLPPSRRAGRFKRALRQRRSSPSLLLFVRGGGGGRRIKILGRAVSSVTPPPLPVSCLRVTNATPPPPPPPLRSKHVATTRRRIPERPGPALSTRRDDGYDDATYILPADVLLFIHTHAHANEHTHARARECTHYPNRLTVWAGRLCKPSPLCIY